MYGRPPGVQDHAHDVESHRKGTTGLRDEGIGGLDQFAALALSHRLLGLAVLGAAAGLHLHEDELLPVLGHQIDLVPPMPPVPVQHLVALLLQEAGRQLFARGTRVVMLRHVWKLKG